MLYCAGGFLPTGTAKIVQTSERISSLLEYFTANAAYFRVANIVFFTTNAQRGIYFFIYNVVCDTALWIFSYLRVIIVHQTQTILWPKKKLLLPL